MKKTLMLASLISLISLSACTTEQFYGTNDPVLIAQMNAQLQANLEGISAQAQQQAAQWRAMGNSYQAPNVPQYIENPNKPGTYLVYCKELGSYVVTCNVR